MKGERQRGDIGEKQERITVKKGILEDIRPLLLILVLLLHAVLAELWRQVDGVLAMPALPLQAELVPPKPERRRPATNLVLLLLLLLVLVLLLLL